MCIVGNVQCALWVTSDGGCGEKAGWEPRKGEHSPLEAVPGELV
jgi:hypothetical protein